MNTLYFGGDGQGDSIVTVSLVFASGPSLLVAGVERLSSFNTVNLIRPDHHWLSPTLKGEHFRFGNTLVVSTGFRDAMRLSSVLKANQLSITAGIPTSYAIVISMFCDTIKPIKALGWLLALTALVYTLCALDGHLETIYLECTVRFNMFFLLTYFECVCILSGVAIS